MMFAGVFDEFPTVRFAFLEAGCAWIPFMMDRMDYEFDSMHGTECRTRMKKRPSEYFQEGESIWRIIQI